MAKLLKILVFLVQILLCVCQEQTIQEISGQEQQDNNPSYSFGYGVSDIRTGDIKTVWEEKEGDTVKGHYSVIEPDGSMRTVEYSAGPNTGFTAVVNNDGKQNEAAINSNLPEAMEDKVLRDYDRYYDFSDDADVDSPYRIKEKKRNKHPYDSLFKDYSYFKQPKYPADQLSEYSHSISIKHPLEDTYDGPAHSHTGYGSDQNCHKKHKVEYFGHVPDLDFRKQKYPPISDSYKYEHDKYKSEASTIDEEKFVYPYKQKLHKPLKHGEYAEPPFKYGFSNGQEFPSAEGYSDYSAPRPKKKYKPHKNLDDFGNVDDYVLVPKRKVKKPPRIIESPEYQEDEEFDQRVPFSGYEEDYEDRYLKPPRATTASPKEVVKKVVKKKPVINLLDIFDI
ncbi:uncharacterized protein LOC126968216 [Leptidea sinapis]|uniref:uncharacterized protein LOC126968216 n=1 Tax=Leptidea sinapis TaxID=189913 RepID=UPI0021232A8A|nr:uncharacterized protein LOC126968216 [Leptidea sinapis]